MPEERRPRCQMCDTVMTGDRHPTNISPEVIRAQVGGLERRLDDLANGAVTPRQVEDEMLWMCPVCQRIVADVRSGSEELEQRIRDEIRRLERRLVRLERHAG
jgi:hypothetical protein